MNTNEETYRTPCAEPELAEELRQLMGSDTARISIVLGIWFLILGTHRNTKQDAGQWTKNGEPIDFDYVEEATVASGPSREALIESAHHYKSLL